MTLWRSKETLKTQTSQQKMGLSFSSIVTGMKMKKDSPPPTSLLSFPNDIVLNILARISRIHYPSLSLVSKTFRSLLASHELERVRSLLGKQPEDDCIYVCLCPRVHNDPKPRWLSLHPNPNHKSTPIPSFPDEHPNSPSVLRTGSEIYIIGGFVNGRSRKVFVLDVKSHKWRILPEMHVPRGNFAAGVLDGKIYVVGGSESSDEDNWGEVYDPKIQTWTTMQTTIPDLSIRKNTFAHETFVVEGRSVSGKVYHFRTWFCLLVKDNILCKASSLRECLMWCDLKEKLVWREIKGLGLPKTPNFISLASSGGGLSVWWASAMARSRHGYRWEVRCAQISIERRSVNEAWGIVEWSKVLFWVDGNELRYNMMVHIATLTHDC